MLMQESERNTRAELDRASLDQLFREARTNNGWLDRPVSDEQLRGIYELMKWGPTSANSSPARLVFLRSREAKQRLVPALAPGNVDQTLQAPVAAIVAQDIEFYERLPELFPHGDARSWFVGNQPLIETIAFRNSSLQGAYLILAAPRPGSGRGANVRLRQRDGRSRVLPRSPSQVEFPREHRLRRSFQIASARPAPRFRGGGADPVAEGRRPT